jgi:hypothetical protein
MERMCRCDPCQSGEKFFESHRPVRINSIKPSPKLAVGKEVVGFQMDIPRGIRIRNKEIQNLVRQFADQWETSGFRKASAQDERRWDIHPALSGSLTIQGKRLNFYTNREADPRTISRFTSTPQTVPRKLKLAEREANKSKGCERVYITKPLAQCAARREP